MKTRTFVLFILVLSLTIFLFQSSTAVLVGISDFSNTTPLVNTNISFLTWVQINTSERLPIQNFTLNISNSTSTYLSCFFDVNGTNLTACTNLNITLLNITNTTNGSCWGLGHGYENSSGSWMYNTTNTTFDNCTGYTNSSMLYEVLFNITWAVPSVANNTIFNFSFETYANDGNNTWRTYKTLNNTNITVLNPPTCINATSNMTIYQNTTFCTSEYNLSLGITFNTSNIVLNCNASTLIGVYNGSGISVNSKSNITIENCNIRSYKDGISLLFTNESNIMNISVSRINYSGVILTDSHNNFLKNITSFNATRGIYFNVSSVNKIINSNLTNTTYGLYLYNGSSNNISFSNLYNNGNVSLFNNATSDVIAIFNYWSNITSVSIEPHIFDENDSSTYGNVDYDPWLKVLHPDTTAPVLSINTSNGTTRWTSSAIVNITVVSNDRVYVKYKTNESGWAICYTIDQSLTGNGSCDTLSALNKTYVFFVNVTNAYGLSSQVNKTITIDYGVIEEPYTGDVITGSGGGGTGGTSVIVSHTWGKLNGTGEFVINRSGFAIRDISFKVKNEVSGAVLTVKQWGSKPPTVSNMTSSVYEYYEITKSKLDSSNLYDIIFKFNVEKSWLTSNDLTASEISFYRYVNGWQKLTTTNIGSDSTYYEYNAQSPGFSYFAIASTVTTTTTQSLQTTTTSTTSTTMQNYSITPSSSTTTTTQAEKSKIVNIDNIKKAFNKKYLLYGLLVLIPIILIYLTHKYHIGIANTIVPKIKNIISLTIKIIIGIFKAPKEPKKEKKKINIDHNDLVDYIKKFKNKGFTKSEITHQLTSEGVTKKTINKLYKEL